MKKVLNILKFPFRQMKMVSRLGFGNYWRYRVAKRGDLVSFKIKDHFVCVRKGTPDLGVAISCLLKGEFDSLTKYLDKAFEGVIIDAGGYIGTAALALSKMFPDAQIITIEPSQANLDILKQNVVGQERIKVVYGALVGREVDSVSLRNRGTGEWGFTAVENPRDNKTAEVLHETPAYTLQGLGVSPSEIGILKLDIEGGEYDLLTNDMETLRQIRVVVAELHDRIVLGCSEAFKKFSEGRVAYKDDGEKYISIKKL